MTNILHEKLELLGIQKGSFLSEYKFGIYITLFSFQYFTMADFYTHKMITFTDHVVGNKISLLDAPPPKCSYPAHPYGFCLHLEFYGKDLGMTSIS